MVERLLAGGYKVTGVDDLSTGKRSNLPENFDLRLLDIRDPQIQDVVADVNPDVVFHLAAQISVSISTREPQLDADVNIGGSLNLLEAIRTLGSSSLRFVYVTSGGTAYGNPEVVPTSESTLLRPLSPYGASKLAVETYLPVYEKLCGISYSILRLANVYGPRQDPHGEAGVVAIFIDSMLKGSVPNVFGDGNDERDYVFVGDVSDAILLASENDCSGPFNIGTGVGTNTNEIFKLLAGYCGYTRRPVHAPPRPGDINRISLDISRARKQLNWNPKTPLEIGLKSTVRWFSSVES